MSEPEGLSLFWVLYDTIHDMVYTFRTQNGPSPSGLNHDWFAITFQLQNLPSGSLSVDVLLS